MVIFFTIIHSLIALGLIGAILLHSGKGTGLSNSFGGGLPTALGGSSVVERNLDRITVILAVAFAVSSVILVTVV